MAFNNNTQWDVRGASSAGSDSNGGGFAYSLGVKGVTAATDLVVDSSNNKKVSSVTHSFVSGDVNKFLNVTAGTQWRTGWYQILSVSGGAAILDQSPAAAGTASGTYDLYTAVDYSQQASAQIAYTDMKIDATTNTKFTSVNNPVTDAHVGNIINVVSGTGFTVQRIQILSQSGGVATCDKSLGTLGSTGGNGNLGGSLATIGQAVTLAVANDQQRIHIQNATYTLTSAISVTQNLISLIGYQTNHYDGGTKPLITTATNSTSLFTFPGTNSGKQVFKNLSLSNTATTRASAMTQLTGHAGSQWVVVTDCTLDGFTIALDFSNIGSAFDIGFLAVVNTEIKNCSTSAINSNVGPAYIEGCWFHGGTATSTSVGYVNIGSTTGLFMVRTLVTDNTCLGVGSGNANVMLAECTIANNSRGGFFGSSSQNSITMWNNVFYNNNSAGAGNLDVHFTAAPNGVLASQILGRNNVFGTGTNGYVPNLTDLFITSDPFTNSAGGDYSLSNSASALLLKQAGFPGAFPAGSSKGYLDIGAVQSAASVEPGSGSSLVGTGLIAEAP